MPRPARLGGSLLVLALACAIPAQACEERLRVAIDIGHDLRDPGAISARGKSEYRFNARLALETMSALKGEPMVDVFLIEEQGRSIPLQERRSRARARNADVMLSIHHDSVQEQFLSTAEHEGKTLRYTELFQGYSLFYSEKNGNPALSRETATALGRALRAASLRPTDHHAMDVEGERREFVDPENGVYRYDGLAVLKADMPTVLLEAGVIVNPEEEALLEHPAYRRLLVAAITQALDEMRCALVSGGSRSASAAR